MLIDLNQVLQEAAPKRQVLTYMLFTCMQNHFVDCYLLDFSVHEILQTRILEWVAIPPPGDLPNPGIKPRSPALQADSLLSEPAGKPSNRWVSYC